MVLPTPPPVLPVQVVHGVIHIDLVRKVKLGHSVVERSINKELVEMGLAEDAVEGHFSRQNHEQRLSSCVSELPRQRRARPGHSYHLNLVYVNIVFPSTLRFLLCVFFATKQVLFSLTRIRCSTICYLSCIYVYYNLH